MLTLARLKELWGEPVHQTLSDLSQDLGQVCTDTRELSVGNFFVPLEGANFDGHSFLEEAFSLGAQATIISSKNKFFVPDNFLHWVVEDTLKAYQQLASLYRIDLGIPVISITGSVGKTTTREFVRAALQPLGEPLSTTSNNNNDVGVPLTLFKANASHSVVILEMGMRGLGEIERLSLCAKPDIAIITNIGSAHIGRLGSRENIAKAKCEITSALRSDGLVVIPAGDYLLEETLKRNWSGRVLRVAIIDSMSHQISNEAIDMHNVEADITGVYISMTSELMVNGVNFNLPFPGRHNAINFMFAIAMAREFGIPFQALKNLDVKMLEGRNSSLIIGQITILDETYNSSPEAVEASLDLLQGYSGRHFAVLGTMLELGEESISLHRKIAQKVIRLGLDGLLIIAPAPEANAMLVAANGLPCLHLVSGPEEAFEILAPLLKPGDVVLLKASRAIGLERMLPLLKAKFDDSFT